MAEILNPNKMNTEAKVQAAAERLIKTQIDQVENKKFQLEKFLNTLATFSPETGGFDEISALLALPEEQFAMLSPVFLSSLEKGLSSINDKLLLVQSMNLLGMTVEQMGQQYEVIYSEIDQQLGAVLSYQKRDFLKRMLAITYNTIVEAEGVAKKRRFSL